MEYVVAVGVPDSYCGVVVSSGGGGGGGGEALLLVMVVLQPLKEGADRRGRAHPHTAACTQQTHH